MATKNYNSFPEAAEVLIGLDGKPHLVRKRQTLEQILANELALPDAVAAAAK
jgi:diaminopimelate decarboxylase